MSKSSLALNLLFGGLLRRFSFALSSRSGETHHTRVVKIHFISLLPYHAHTPVGGFEWQRDKNVWESMFGPKTAGASIVQY